jgi:retron-type reverse transcriptase
VVAKHADATRTELPNLREGIFFDESPLGIAAVEDKIVQQAVVTILNQIYESTSKSLLTGSGFRRGRGRHQALDALALGIPWKTVNCVLDADIRGSTNDRFLTDADRCPIHRWPGIPHEPKISQVHR